MRVLGREKSMALVDGKMVSLTPPKDLELPNIPTVGSTPFLHPLMSYSPPPHTHIQFESVSKPLKPKS
jgi:hypothetical protein